MHPVQSLKMPLKLTKKIEKLTRECQKLEPGLASRLTHANVLRALLELATASPKVVVAHISAGGLKRGNPHSAARSAEPCATCDGTGEIEVGNRKWGPCPDCGPKPRPVNAVEE